MPEIPGGFHRLSTTNHRQTPPVHRPPCLSIVATGSQPPPVPRTRRALYLSAACYQVKMVKYLLVLLSALICLSATSVNAFAPSYPRFSASASDHTQPSHFTASNPTTSTTLFGKKAARAQGNERKGRTERVKKVKDDVIEVEGTVIESLPNAMFRCTINGAPDTQEPVLATISGKIRKNFVKILVGDSVTIELSPYDLTRGRITFRTR